MINYWQEILKLIESGEVTIAKISKDTGIRSNKITMWKLRGYSPKLEDYIKLRDWYEKRHPGTKENRPHLFEMEPELMVGVVLETAAMCEVILSALAQIESKISAEPAAKVLRRYEASLKKQLGALKQRLSDASH